MPHKDDIKVEVEVDKGAPGLSPDVSECRRCRRCRSSVGAVSERCRLTLVSTVSEVSGLCLTGV